MKKIEIRMAEVISDQKYTIENSTHLTRPGLKLFMQPDTNSGETNVVSFNEKQNRLKLHVPSATGAPDFAVNCCTSVSSKGEVLKKLNTLTVIDPISSFISPSGEVLLCTNKYGLATFGKARREPQTTVPQLINSIRQHPDAINELKRLSSNDTNPDLKWNSQKVSDTVLKSRLGGWTSAKAYSAKENDIRKFNLNDVFPNMRMPKYANNEERNELAKNYMYTTSTQAAYATVNWDSKLPKKLHAPTTTYEKQADPIKHSDQEEHRTQIWQTSIGSTWDRRQERFYHLSKEPVRFVAPLTRAKQIPGYSGCIGGKNVDSMDDVIEKFEPFTVLRTIQPKEPEPNFKSNIPGYTGHAHHFKTSNVSHYDKEGRAYTTTAAYHREMPNVTHKLYSPSLYGDFSKIQTKVPPSNPYDNIDRPVETNQNLACESQNFPIVINKNPNDAQYMVASREKELKSILKKETANSKSKH